MKSPRDRYMSDPNFHALVNLLESYIHKADFTASELREAAVLASINYEMNTIRPMNMIDPEIEKVLQTFNKKGF